MTPFMRMREHIRRFVHMHEIGFFRVLHGLYMLVSLVVIAGAFPFATGLNRPWIIAALSGIGIFMPLSAEVLVLFVFLFINLFSLSGAVCGVLAGLVAISYMFCSVYQS
ncbi:MAG: hypothetical protein IJ679_01895, partial [Lachnospiraceae bacterium]|nr:hypothetical protein [Lachnospiraceae bacterium]